MSPSLTAARRAAAAGTRGAGAHTPGARAASRRAASAPPRRVSGPVGGRLKPSSAGRLRPRHAPRESVALAGRAFALVRGLPDHSVIDRLVRGRAWIPLLGVLLAGIVAMQVEILKLGTSMGRALQRSTTLQTQNEWLQARVAGLADDHRIERLAAGMGMVMPTPASLVFLHVRPSGDVGRAISNIQVPNPTAFASQLAAEAANAAALLPAAPAATSATGMAGTAASTSTATASTPTTSASTPSSTVTPTSSSAATSTVAPTGSAAPASSTPTVAASPATTSAPAGGATAVTGAASVAPTSSSQLGTGGG